MNVFEIGDVWECKGVHPDDGKKCREPLRHPVEQCEVCGSSVRWVKSLEKYDREQNLAPEDRLGVQMLTYISRKSKLRNAITCFKNVEQRRLWKLIIEKLPESRIREIVNECGETRRGYGWVEYVINKCRYEIERSHVDEPEHEYTGDIP